jgi:hypothetical protein
MGRFEGISGWFWKLLYARKSLTDAGLEVVPGDGIEPPTRGFEERSRSPVTSAQREPR